MPPAKKPAAKKPAAAAKKSPPAAKPVATKPAKKAPAKKELTGAAKVLALKAEAAKEKTSGWDAGGERGPKLGPGPDRPTRSNAARRASTSR